MLDWKELIKKENLSIEEIRQIPCRCNVTHQDNIKRYIDNGWDVSTLIHNLPYSLDDLLDENLWLDPIDVLQFDINYHKNLPHFEPHFDQYYDGLKFFDDEGGIHRILIKLTSLKQILVLSNEISSKFNNEAKIEYIPINRNSGYVYYKPNPFKHIYSMGHECHFTRGVMESILKLKGYEEYSFKELFCSAKFENILRYYYKDLNIKLNKKGDWFILNGKIIAEKVRINLNELLSKTLLPETKKREIVRITENIDYKGFRIFNRGEIYNAPYCCYDLEWKQLSLIKSIRQVFGRMKTHSAYKKLEEQLKIAQQKTHEANQSKYLLEQEILKKDKFLRSTSHELRTPLNGIIGLVDSVLASGSNELSPNNLINLNTASISAWRLARLINDILDFSKMRENSLILQKEHVSLHQVVDFVIRNLEPLLFGKPVRMEVNLSLKLPEIWVDENRLQQILFNLLGNALKFTHKGSIVISAKVQHDKLLISIKDTGIGIPGDKLESIFSEYEQGSEEITHRYGGTGIGLTVTKQLIELHGGKIWAESEYGKSSCFFFTMPIAVNMDYSTAITLEPDTLNAPFRSEYKGDFSISDWRIPGNGESMIIAVDDEPINLKVIQNYLSKDKYIVNSLVSGNKLLEYLKDGLLPELVILDIFMPEISGYELCTEIRKVYSPIELPVLMLTASNNLEDMVNAFSLGANDYITKPVSRGELVARVETHIKLKKSIERIELSNKKLNIIDRLISFGLLTSTFILQKKISPDQDNIILKKAYDYYKPVLDQFTSDLDEPESSLSKIEEQGYLESVFDKLNNFESGKKLELLYQIEQMVQSNADKDFNKKEIEEISTMVFDLVSSLLLMETPKDSANNPDLTNFGMRYDLTPKEIETVTLIYKGYSNQEIAGSMDIALNTVKQHIFHIFNKVGVENRTHLIYKLVGRN